MTNCPCDNCICLAVCRHKWFHDLTQNCKLIYDYFSNDDTTVRKGNTVEAEKYIRPTRWYVGSELEHDYDIVYIESDSDLGIDRRPKK